MLKKLKHFCFCLSYLYYIFTKLTNQRQKLCVWNRLKTLIIVKD